MKQCFLTYQVGEKQDISFNLDIRDWVKKNIPGISMYDLDNHSELFLVDMISHELANINQLLVYIRVYGPADPGILFSRLATLVRKGISLGIILDGNDERLKKTGQILAKDNFICDINFSDQQNNILNFFMK